MCKSKFIWQINPNLKFEVRIGGSKLKMRSSNQGISQLGQPINVSRDHGILDLMNLAWAIDRGWTEPTVATRELGFWIWAILRITVDWEWGPINRPLVKSIF